MCARGFGVQGAQQDDDVPIIFIDNTSRDNIIADTMVGHGFIDADFLANPSIDVATGKVYAPLGFVAARSIARPLGPSGLENGRGR